MSTQTKFIIGTILGVAGFIVSAPICYIFAVIGGSLIGSAVFDSKFKNK